MALPPSLPRLLLPSLLALAVLPYLAGCRPAGSRDLPADAWNVLLVTFDTTRADRLGCYGNARIRTPAVDRLAAEGVRFRRALAAVPVTAPSHSTILTGRYPIAHGVRDNGLFVLGEEQRTLAEVLGDAGYATAAAIGAYPLTARFGLDQGFDRFDDHLTGRFEDYLGQRAVPKERLFFDERRAAQVNEAILPWLSERAQAPPGRPFFAWVHYFDPHRPFEPAPPYNELYADDLYNGEIAYADSRLGFLLDHLESLSLLDRTLVVMTADHGEGLGEHNELTHAVLAYNSTLHVPLIVRPPAGAAPAGAVVEDWVGTVDVVPTVLDLLGLEPPEGVQGTSLAPLWRGERPPRRHTVRYAENLSPRLTHGWGELRVLFEGPMKYIHGPRPELYDLEADPHETHDLSAERPREARRLRRNLEAFLERHAVAGASTTEALDEEVRQRLLALGYLHGTGGGGEAISETLRGDGIPPRERVGDVNDLSTAKHLLFAGRATDALPLTARLLRASPENPLYLELHATALAGVGRLDEAWKVAERLHATGAGSDLLLLRLASARFEAGEEVLAMEGLRRYLETNPSAAGGWLLASFLHRRGQPEGARAALEQVLEREPDFAPARVDLGIRLAQAGDTAAAERELLRSLADDPYYPKAHYNYGTLLLHDQRYPEAIGSFRRAIALAPGYLEARLALVAALLADGRDDEARQATEALRGLAPGSREATLAAGFLAAP